MATSVCYGRCAGLAPADHIQLVAVCIQNDSVLRICITLNGKGCYGSVYGLADRRKLRIFLNLSYSQIDRRVIIIALCIIGCHSNYADGIRANLVQLACGNRVRRSSKVLCNECIRSTVIQIHVVLEGNTGRCSRLVPGNLEAIACFDLLITCSRNRRSSALSKGFNSYSGCIFTAINYISIFI